MSEVCAVTGATGYVGSRLAEALGREFTVVPVTRSGVGGMGFDLAAPVDLAAEFKAKGVGVLVHAGWGLDAGKADEYRRVNVEGSRRLIESAKAGGVGRIVFVSTISAFAGARSLYGRSKLAVETMVIAAGGTVVRPGLVWGERPGGMFGSMREQVKGGGRVPVIGDGRFPQYLVHEDDLAEVVVRAAKGEFAGRVLTVANPAGWMLRDLILRIAAGEGKSVKLVGVPWWLIYGGLKTAEGLGVKLGFRSDSVLSLVYQDKAPEFSRDVRVREFR